MLELQHAIMLQTRCLFRASLHASSPLTTQTPVTGKANVKSSMQLMRISNRATLQVEARKGPIGTISSRSRHNRPAVHRKLGKRGALPSSSKQASSKTKDLVSSKPSRTDAAERLPQGYGWRQMVPGDNGWDLFKLRKTDAKTFNRFREVEVIHARWAMLGVIALLLGDLAGSPFPPKQASLAALAPWGLVLLLLLAFIESYRLAALWNVEDYEKRTYPGRPFDFLGLTQPSKQQQADEQPPGLGVYSSWLGGPAGWLAGGWWFSRREMTEVELLDMKSRELRNGRLAMVSFIGCCMASALTGKGPITLLVEHISDPLHNTIMQSLQ